MISTTIKTWYFYFSNIDAKHLITGISINLIQMQTQKELHCLTLYGKENEFNVPVVRASLSYYIEKNWKNENCSVIADSFIPPKLK